MVIVRGIVLFWAVVLLRRGGDPWCVLSKRDGRVVQRACVVTARMCRGELTYVGTMSDVGGDGAGSLRQGAKGTPYTCARGKCRNGTAQLVGRAGQDATISGEGR